ncbi:MAG: hypothetical protein MUP70_08165, partial [Candidatus Aminicenantes bacterium]|nr:hypothetical protein [Candidatus Aminicenantes bacterium]
LSEGKRMNIPGKKSLVIFIGLFFCLSGPFAFSQFTEVEIEQRPFIEKLLKEAKIIDDKDIGEGVTKPSRLFLETEEFKLSGVWKNPEGVKDGFLEGWQYEIAAYRMDKLLGLNMIPPTVERVFKGKRGSLQYWVTSEMSDLDRMEKGAGIPATVADQWSKRKYLTRAFDSLIANEDRTQQNIRYTSDWRTILIDHSRSFRSTKKFSRRLISGKNGIKGVQPIRQLPREFVEKVKALTYDQIKSAVGETLTDKEIKAVLARKTLLLEEIEDMIKEKGEKEFLW